MVVGSLLAACDGDNQLPFATVDTLPMTTIMTERSMREYYVDGYFRDPDRDLLSLTASIDDATVATAVLEDLEGSPRLVVDGLTGGETIVTLTATDPHGGEAQISGQILVVEPVLLWRDDFDVNTGKWLGVNGDSYDYRPGYLSSKGDNAPVRVDRDNAMEWMVSMSVATEEGSTSQTVGFWSTSPCTSSGCSPIMWKWAALGWTDELGILGPTPGSNWQVVYCCSSGYQVAAYGEADGVAPVGEFSEMHWGVRLGRMELFVGETLVFSQEAAEGPTGNDDVGEGWPLVHGISALFEIAGGGETGQWVYFDWAELWGIPVEEGEADFTGDWQLQEETATLKAMPLAGVVSQEMDLIAQ